MPCIPLCKYWFKANNTSPDCSLSFAPAKAELRKVDFGPRLIKALPWCHSNNPVDIPPSSVTQSTYLKCSGIQHSQKESTEFLRSDSEPVSLHVGSRQTGCLCRAIRCSCVPREKLLRASWKHQAQGYIWRGAYLLAWSSQKLVDMAEKPFLNTSWKFSTAVHEMFTTWHSIYWRRGDADPCRKAQAEVGGWSDHCHGAHCVLLPLREGFLLPLLLSLHAIRFKAVCQEELACLAGFPSPGFFK